MGPSVKGDGVNAPILSIKTRLESNCILTYIRINARNIWRHHELHVEAFVSISDAIVGSHLILVLHGHWVVVSIARFVVDVVVKPL
jgi:hypothetical protein